MVTYVRYFYKRISAKFAIIYRYLVSVNADQTEINSKAKYIEAMTNNKDLEILVYFVTIVL